jgi:hypothetical protein
VVPGTDRPSRLVAIAATLTLFSVLLVGCSDDAEEDTPVGQGDSAGVTATQARKQEQRILNQRTRAVRDGNLDLFLRRVDHSDKALMTRQRRYFQNLVQLPLAKLRFRVTDEQWQGLRTPKRWGSDVHVPRVRQVMQLEGYDAVPVERIVGLVFSFRKGRARIVSDRTATGKMLFEGTPAPWDLTAVTVREEPGVLAVFDRGTSASADAVTAVVRDGIDDIDRALPFTWSGRVVVYSVQSPKVLASFTDVPGGTLEHLGALTFPTYAESGGPQVASTRMLVMPSSVDAGQPFLGRITRHELSHIAVGVRDDGAPAWVSEGLAEYLGAREIPLRDRIIPTSALNRAQAEVATMPESQDFNNTDQEWHYALSWMACDYVAATHGEGRLWELVDAMHNGGEGTSDREQDRVLVQLLGYDGAELASRAAARIRNLYG